MRLGRLRRETAREDCGQTLVEVLVVMIVFSLIMGIITAGIVSMLRQQNRQSAIATDMDSARKLVQLLDRQVRYANAITAPGTGTDGNTYFEWRTGNKGQQQTCTQWRYVSSLQRIETRSWQPPLAGNGAVTPTSWTVAVPGIKTNGANPLFSLAAPSALGTHETLTVNYAATSGGPAVSSSSQISITALNTSSTSAPSGLCNEVSRP